MPKFKIKRKIDFYSSLSLFVLIFISMSMKYVGIGLPKEESLSYTTGILNLREAGREKIYVELYDIGKEKESQIFACDHSIFGNTEINECGSKKIYEPYINKEVTVGYYKQKKMLWVENDIPQLVTVQSGNKFIKSYASTIDRIRTLNETRIFMIIFALPFSIFIYWAFGTLHKKGK